MAVFVLMFADLKHKFGQSTQPLKTVDKNKQHLRIDRRYHRLATTIACEVCGIANEERLPALILNLSIGGLKFRCGLQVINSILPEDQRTPGQILDVEMEICFDLPLGNDTPVKIKTRASVVHSERLAQDEFHVGVQFIESDDGVARQIKRYINIVQGEKEH